jgi:hypothetical protein
MTNQTDPNKKVYIFSVEASEAELIEALSKHFSNGTEELFRKAILLMGIAIQQVAKNNKIVIIDEKNDLIDTIDF